MVVLPRNNWVLMAKGSSNKAEKRRNSLVETSEMNS